MLWSTAALTLVPWPSLKNRYEAYVCSYLTVAWSTWSGRTEFISHARSQLNSLIDRVRLMPGVERILIVGYSFGTVIAIDTLFPQRRHRRTQHAQVKKLITFGCPFEMIRAYSPQFLNQREVEHYHFSWTNIYSRSDILSSQFASVGVNVAGEPGRKLGEPGMPYDLIAFPGVCDVWIFLLVLVRGIRAHAAYWDCSHVPTGNAISRDIIDIIFPHDLQKEEGSPVASA